MMPFTIESSFASWRYPRYPAAEAATMDPKQFDAFVQALGAKGTRRVALRWIAGALAADFVAPTGARGKGSRGHGRSSRAAADSSTDSRRQRPACAAGLTRCPAGRIRHGKHRRHVCVNTQTAADHCGACARTCAAGEHCRFGRCRGADSDCIPDCQDRVCGLDGCSSSCGRCPQCETGSRCCDGRCVQGNCCEDTDCAGGQTCGGSSTPHLCSDPCGPESCFGCCNGATCVEVLDQNNQTCGLGGITCSVCTAGTFCQDGQCTCREPGELCDPTISPDQCCVFSGAICVGGGPNPHFGGCCLQDGAPCSPNSNSDCVPGSGCCCSGRCSSSGFCASSS